MIICIESPCKPIGEYSFHDNRSYLRDAMQHVFREGHIPIASHALYAFSGMLDDTIPHERALGIKAGFELAKCADEAWFFMDHGMSSGMKAAQKHWLKMKMPIRMLYIGASRFTETDFAKARETNAREGYPR